MICTYVGGFDLNDNRRVSLSAAEHHELRKLSF